MEKYHNPVPFHLRSPYHQLFTALLIIVVLGAVLFLSSVYIGSKISGVDVTVLDNITGNLRPAEVSFIKFLLIAQDISFFIIPGMIMLIRLNPGYPYTVSPIRLPGATEILMVSILAFCAFPVTGLAGELNSKLLLPDKLHGVGEWIRDKEDYADNMLSLLISSRSLREMWMNIFIVAALPAISEELIFRGILQRIFQNMFRSGHIAVWVTSVIFSTIHFQFYGFLPRLLLGLMFGYLFLWSGSLWLPVIAHFINNAVPVAGAYIRGWESLNAVFSGGITNQLLQAVLPAAAGIIILGWFRKRSRNPGRYIEV
jgi:membrane protease YdiL (CAAX protease family)